MSKFFPFLLKSRHGRAIFSLTFNTKVA